MRDLTQHLTARADDSHAAPVQQSRRKMPFLALSTACQAWVRFFALHRIKPHAPLLVRVPVNSFEFQPCDHTPQAEHLANCLRQASIARHPSSVHSLRRGLPGYLILFAPHAFVPQCQLRTSRAPSALAFRAISTHFTATLLVPPTPHALKFASIKGSSTVGPRDFTPDLTNHLRTLYAQ